MTVPACAACNGGFSLDETRTAAVVCTVSFMEEDRQALAPGGWLATAMKRDADLKLFVSARLGSDEIFRADEEVLAVISRVMRKTALGLLFHEFGRVVPLEKLDVLAIEHVNNVHATTLTERHRREDGLWSEVTPSCRELERQVLAMSGYPPPSMPAWRIYAPRYFEYMFLKRSNGRLLVSLKIHNALAILLDAPWPSKAGPYRGGKPSLP